LALQGSTSAGPPEPWNSRFRQRHYTASLGPRGQVSYSALVAGHSPTCPRTSLSRLLAWSSSLTSCSCESQLTFGNESSYAADISRVAPSTLRREPVARCACLPGSLLRVLSARSRYRSISAGVPSGLATALARLPPDQSHFVFTLYFFQEW
jgi:hypothetical protein